MEILHDGLVAASVLLTKQKKNPGWISLDTSALFDFVMSLHRNITGTVLQMVLSRLGGVRMTKEDVITTGAAGKLKGFYPWMVWSDQSAFYVCVEDLSNHTYSAWLGAVACGRYGEVYSRNQDMQGDMVEAALGMLHRFVLPEGVRGNSARA